MAACGGSGQSQEIVSPGLSRPKLAPGAIYVGIFEHAGFSVFDRHQFALLLFGGSVVTNAVITGGAFQPAIARAPRRTFASSVIPGGRRR